VKSREISSSGTAGNGVGWAAGAGVSRGAGRVTEVGEVFLPKKEKAT
jgi:hypothetical protein